MGMAQRCSVPSASLKISRRPQFPFSASRVRAVMESASGFDSDQTVDPEFYDRLVLWRWVLNCGLALWVGSSEKPEWYDTVRSEYQQLREKFAGASNKARQDVGTKGSISSGPAGNLWLK